MFGMMKWHAKLVRPMTDVIVNYQHGNHAAVLEAAPRLGQTALDISVEAGNKVAFIQANQSMNDQLSAGAQMIARGSVMIMQSVPPGPNGEIQFDSNAYEGGIGQVLQGWSYFSG